MRHYDQDTTKIRVHPGESFTVSLAAQAGAGYTWRVASELQGLRLVSDAIQPSSTKLGANAAQEFVFEAEQPGEVTLELAYGRPWEKSPSQTHRIQVVVES
jgi:predicted secreted protein